MKDLQERIKQLEQALDMAQLVSSQYRDVFFDCLNFSSRGKLSPNDARAMLMHYIAMLSEKQKCLSETSPATYKKLKQEIETLRADREKLVETLRLYANGWQGVLMAKDTLKELGEME